MTEQIAQASWEPGYTENPHPVFARLREAPVTKVLVEGLPVWLVTRYDDVREVLSDPRLSNDPMLADEVTRAVPWVGASMAVARHMVRVDPPEHTRLRRLLAKAFTPRRIEALRPRIQQIADKLVAAIQPNGRADLLAEFAAPLPLTVISELLGVPATEQREFSRWVHVFFGVDEGDAAHLLHARASIRDYLARLIEERQALARARPLADAEQGALLDGLIAARDEGQQLNHDELLAMASLLIFAGYDTTVNLIANGLASLLRSPDQYAALAADPAMIKPAIEEFLRFESPVKVTPIVRITTTEVTIGGVAIPAQQPVLVAFAAANRDPGHFPDPDRLDISRAERGHLAFGHGIHFCLGAPLARLEAEIAFTTIMVGCPDLALAIDGGALQWRHSRTLRALKSLPVTFTAPGRARSR